MSQDWPEGQEGEEDYVPPPLPRRSAPRPAAPPTQRAAPPPARTAQRYASPRYTSSPVAARRAGQRPAAGRDTFPLAVTAVAILLVLGLGLVFLTANPGNSGNTAGGNTNAGGAPAATVPAAQTGNNGIVITVNPQAQPTAGSDPPRMKLADFKALYDDPAKRPLILDVRAKEAYDQGHIVGAESFPEADVDARYTELPKDKLIVAYCQ